MTSHSRLAVGVVLATLLLGSACASTEERPPPNGFASAEDAAAGYVAGVAARDPQRLVEISVQAACDQPTDYPVRIRAFDRIARYGAIRGPGVGVRVLESPAPPDVRKTVELSYSPGQSDLVDAYLVDGRWFIGIRAWESPEKRAKLPELSDPADVVRLPPRQGPKPEPGSCDWVF